MVTEQIKKSGSKIVNATGKIIGWKQISGMFDYMKHIAVMIVKGPQKGNEQSFEEAVEQYQLTEEDIRKKADGFFKQAMVLGLIALVFLGFTIFRLYLGYFIQGGILFSITALLFANAFKAHFWYFQIKNRKLGCTFSEWFNGKITQ